ncbi:MAG TPA: SurA N-terminal domain-containing protein [Hanamia sp.]|jgi:peptidyl-prolyl cis-trans isomerase D|nr:SurA N-terminal domain-containing protein [Hanamia sp.]
MSIIQTIREKGAVIVIALIAISLIGFILMDSMSSGRSIFGNNNTSTLGVVNGEKIDLNTFNDKVKEIQQQYPDAGSSQNNQIMESVWNQMVAEKVVDAQFQKLGITFTPDEMSSIMFSNDAPQTLKQAFTDKQTGQYDIEQAKQWWAQTKKNKNEEQRNAIIAQVIDPMRLNSLYTKYTSMIAGSMYQPKWLSKEMTEEKNQFANISYVAVPYTVISDSALKVTDKDIQDYLDNHKAKYQQEPGRIISYVSFSAAANAEDSARILQSLKDLKPQFAADSNAKFFLGRNSSAVPFFDGYTPKSKLQVPNKDSIIDLPNGGVFGPYEDGKNFVLAKKVDTKIMPDSIECRHILLGTVDPQTQQPIMDDSTAHRIADSIATAIKGGANFDSLEVKYSTDQAAKQQNGVMTFDLMTIQSENFSKEFADFLLNDKGETKKVVKTQFGWHYIEILDKKNPEPAYKIAYMAKEIAPSDQTINAANTAAIKLSGMAKDEKSFNDYVAKNGLKKITVPVEVKENDYQLGALQDARSVVKWAFDAKEGQVSDPFAIKDDYVVAIVDKKLKKGLPDVNTARPMVEGIIMNNKKAGEIKKKLNNPATLEAAAAPYHLQVLTSGADSTLTFQAQIINGIGNEPRVAGAAFNKEYQTKVSPAFAGNTGVFVIKVNNVSSKVPVSPEIEKIQMNEELQKNIQAALGQSFQALKKTADIKDNRSRFF